MNFGRDFEYICALCIEKRWIYTVLKNSVLGKSSHSQHTLAEQANTLYRIEGENAESSSLSSGERLDVSKESGRWHKAEITV